MPTIVNIPTHPNGSDPRLIEHLRGPQWDWSVSGDRGTLRCVDPELLTAIASGAIRWPAVLEVEDAYSVGGILTYLDADDTASATYAIGAA